ncbi:MAG: winged helix-turn-helix domain-containing protein, partial [Proteobacteria bacterium]|nr:winged helix-turn-helix domain-containing protein [Pseudomonadota bacterium]
MKEIPTFDSLMNPLLNALSHLGGSGSIDEIYEKVAELEDIEEEVLSTPHNPEKSNQTEVAYRLAWARTYLRKYGFLENSSRGICTLTQKAKEQKDVIPPEVVKYVRQL